MRCDDTNPPGSSLISYIAVGLFFIATFGTWAYAFFTSIGLEGASHQGQTFGRTASVDGSRSIQFLTDTLETTTVGALESTTPRARREGIESLARWPSRHRFLRPTARRCSSSWGTTTITEGARREFGTREPWANQDGLPSDSLLEIGAQAIKYGGR